jgi:hypothetical protein
LRVYADIAESSANSAEIIWKSDGGEMRLEGGEFGIRFYDSDANGLYDRVSWVVPHLSEQNFDILVELKNGSGGEAVQGDWRGIEIEVISAPWDVRAIETLIFGFNITSNIDDITCNFKLSNQSQILRELILANYNLTLSTAGMGNGSYFWDLKCESAENSSIYRSANGSFSLNIPIGLDVTEEVTLSVNKINLLEGENALFNVNISASNQSEVNYTLSYGDGTASILYRSRGKVFNSFAHIYSRNGSYFAELRASVGGNVSVRTAEISVLKNTSGIGSAGSLEDSSSPQIYLLSPEDDAEIINNGSIIFVYKATDNKKISNCTLSVYFFNNSALFGVLEYNKTTQNVENNTNISSLLNGLEKGDYSWEIECYDESGNTARKERNFELSGGSDFFEVKISSNFTDTSEDYEFKEDVEYLVGAINHFLVEEEKYGTKEREVIEDLKIGDTLSLYKKKLFQIEQDLSFNLAYVKDESLKEKRRKEIINDINEMKLNVPLSLKVEDSYEYSKNTIDSNLEDIVDLYAEGKNLVLGKGASSALALYIGELQNKAVISSNVKHVEIKYEDSVRKFTLISKKIDAGDISFTSVLEVIPKEVVSFASEAQFINEFDIVGNDSMVEVWKDELIDQRIIYSVDSFVSFEDVEKSDTLIFEEKIDAGGLGGMSGFVSWVGVGESRAWFYPSWVLFIALMVFVIFVGSKRITFVRWRREETFRNIMREIKETEKAIKEANLEKAKSGYHKIQKIYPFIPQPSKKYVYKKIRKLRGEIDKKDVSIMVKECISALEGGMRDEAIIIYSNIKKIFDGLPEDVQNKTYSRMQPYFSLLLGSSAEKNS